MIVEQFLPAFHYGDALGNYSLRLHEFLLEQGIESRIISYTIDENMQDKAIFFEDYKENKKSIKILHFAIPSGLTDYFLRLKGKKVMIYHNITPCHFFSDFSDELVRFTNEGRKHLKRLNASFDISIADSEYNANELYELKYKNIHVFPVMIDLKEYGRPFNKPYYNLYKDDRKNIIFVGRISPNKKIEDLVKILFYYKKYISPSVRLIIAGNTATLPKYFLAVRDLASRFYLTSDDIVFTGHIPFDELLAVFKLGDVFISMSEHEGFSVPLIESSFFQVPIIAYDAGAVAGTLNKAGLIVKHKRHDFIAGLAYRVMTDKNLNKKLKNLQQQRIGEYRESARPEKFLKILKQL